MSSYWAFWMGGLALSAVALGHWLLLNRMFAVSGRFTALVDRVRFGAPKEPAMSDAEMIEALRALTRDAMGEGAVSVESVPQEVPLQRPAQTAPVHAAFLVSLVVGGAIAAATTSGFRMDTSVRSELFSRFFGSAPWVGPLVLGLGGVLVGVGTRMAGGCTSGHGLCGVSRVQPGSMLSTAAFFGMGVALSFLIGWLA